MNVQALGDHAQRLLDDPVLGRAFDEVGQQLISQWTNTQPTEAALRERLWATYSVLGEAQRVLRTWVQDGQIERASK
jgi:hypothetical protein